MKLAFTGIAGSGKDFLVDCLIKEHDYTRVSFSDQLKKIAAMVYPWLEMDYPAITKEAPLDIYVTETGEHITKTPRQIWLHLNKLRGIEDGIFLRMLQNQILEIETDNLVISDIRPKLEWDWCKNNDFITIYVERPNNPYEPNEFDKQVLNYKEEADYVFINDCDGLYVFRKFIEEVIENEN